LKICRSLAFAVQKIHHRGHKGHRGFKDLVIERLGSRRDGARAVQTRRCLRCGGPLVEGDLCGACCEFFKRLRARNPTAGQGKPGMRRVGG